MSEALFSYTNQQKPCYSEPYKKVLSGQGTVLCPNGKLDSLQWPGSMGRKTVPVSLLCAINCNFIKNGGVPFVDAAEQRQGTALCLLKKVEHNACYSVTGVTRKNIPVIKNLI